MKMRTCFFISLLAALSFASSAMAAVDVYDSIKKEVLKNESEMTQNFEKIHANPELGFQEVQTATMVAAALQKYGYEVHTKIGVTGVVGILKNGPGPVVMFRADMDALPIKELAKVPYASKKVIKNKDGADTPLAHACGHDAHVTWLIETGKQMARLKDRWKGTLVLVAQPAEELGAGALKMLEQKLYKVAPMPDFLISAHTSPVLPAGKVGIRGGRRLSGSTSLNVNIKGIGGHGSAPHLAKDPIVMGALAVTEYQAIISRVIDPTEIAVLTVGQFHAGTSSNIIPDQANLEINLRWFDVRVKDKMVNSIKSMTDGVALSFGLNKDEMPSYKIVGGATPVINDEETAEKVKVSLEKVLGKDNVGGGEVVKMASEDFHLLASPSPKTKIVWVEVGSGTSDVDKTLSNNGFVAYNHNPFFKVETPALKTGAIAMTAVLFDLFPAR